ncbi:MAG TPA: hypothetical protein VFO18_13175, partial [Methylomirabilota bacterium]|nr:hypothetical protein [Methylomirabilota bacterium]
STAPLMNPPRFWVLSAEQALKQVQGRESGLSSPEAAERLHGRDLPGARGDREALVLPALPDVAGGVTKVTELPAPPF